MRTKICLIASLFVMLIACKKDTSDTLSTSGITYSQSLNNWAAFKQSVKNSYTYTVTTGSWAGFSTETKLTIVNGAVTKREYAFSTQTNGVSTVTKSWIEVAPNLNTHGAYEGAAILTLDEVYTKAAKEWLKADASKNTIYFETKNNGMISSCGYVPNGCQDDCFNGITIKDISAISTGAVVLGAYL